MFLIRNGNFPKLRLLFVKLKSDELDINALNSWLRENLPAYKTPRLYHMLPELPRNAMGKVTKNDLKKYFPER